MAKRQKKKSSPHSLPMMTIGIVILVVVFILIYQSPGSTSPGEKEEMYGNTQSDSLECVSPYILVNGACCPDMNEDSMCDVAPPSDAAFEEKMIDYEEEFHLASVETFPVKSASSLPGSVAVSLGGWVGIDDDPQLGNPDAPVTVIEFSNYECVPCVDAYKHIFPALKKNYIDTGKVLYVARDYVYETGTSQGAFRAAIAANCAREQGKYWEMRDLLFENTKHFSPATLSIHAKALGLDMTKFRYCLDDGYRQEVSDDYQDGKAAGMKAGTLAYYVNGFKVLTSSFDQLNVTIDNVLTGKWS